MIKDPNLNWEGSCHGPSILSVAEKLKEAGDVLDIFKPYAEKVYVHDKVFLSKNRAMELHYYFTMTVD